MKVDRNNKGKKGTSEVPEDCNKVINLLKLCSEEELLLELKKINVWFFGKCELYHWVDVLDRFDTILADAAKSYNDKQWIFQHDVYTTTLGEEKGLERQELVSQVLKFTALLIEHSYARHLYNSIEHLITLLDCVDGGIILSVLNLIYVFSKRSNYLSRLPSDKKKSLQGKLSDLAQTWGGEEAGCSLSQCCSEEMLAGAGDLYYEYYRPGENSFIKDASMRCCIDLKRVHEMSPSVGTIMEDVVGSLSLPDNIQVSFYHRLRLAHAMASKEKRLQFVQARLQAVSILVYSNATTHINFMVYDGLIEEIVNTLKLPDQQKLLSEVKASCLKTLTAIIHLDRNPRLQTIIDSTGATSYHGFLPSLVRQCILHMTDPDLEPFPQPLATSLFSFLYHLASYESGCEALVASGLIESLLKVVRWPGQNDHITFVTRAVRVIDLITNLDTLAFQTHNGLDSLVGRLQREVLLCSKQHGPSLSASIPINNTEQQPNNEDVEMGSDTRLSSTGHQCLPQRAALLKSILNFLKKAIPDPAFADYTRTLMDESLQDALKLIISNAEYYGALLFLLATDVVTVFIFHEPSLLSSLQDTGLTWVVLKALLLKDVPATRENLASLPNTLSALCLNTRGLNAFVSCNPFERLFQILITPGYLPAMKRRRSTDPQGDTAIHLGSAMDELMRHQPTLKVDAMKAIIKLLEELCKMGRDKNTIAFHPADKTKIRAKDRGATNEEQLSEDEMDDDYQPLLLHKNNSQDSTEEDPAKSSTSRSFVPVVDYLLNVTKFLDNILSNNGTDDHCVEFVRLGGLQPLFQLLNMSNFPLEFPMMPACQSIAQVCKSIAVLSQNQKVFKEGLSQLDTLLDTVASYLSGYHTNGSVLLQELASTKHPFEALSNSEETPLVHALTATHAYINIFVFMTSGAQFDVRNMSITRWSSDLGGRVLKKLTNLYRRLVWESSVLYALCTSQDGDDTSFAHDEMKLLQEKSAQDATKGDNSLLKWLLLSSSHLSCALAELFGLLVHQCVNSHGPRLRHTLTKTAAPSISAYIIASQLTTALVSGLNWECPSNTSVSRLRLTFYISYIGFCTPALFDNQKSPYHLQLQQFEKKEGLEALFQRFNWMLEEYLSNKETEVSNGITEFLEGWMVLVGRLVNTKSVLESTHTLPSASQTAGFIPFDPVDFLAKTHKWSFNSMRMLWNHKIVTTNKSIAESVLTILCHIINGEAVLKERFAMRSKSKDGGKPKKTEFQKTPAPTTLQQAEVLEEHIQQFVDMGFAQEQARDMLFQCNGNFAAATELLLANTTPSSGASSRIANMMEIVSDEEMMVQAIAISLGQNIEPNDKEPTSKEPTKLHQVTDEELHEFSETITEFTESLLDGCFVLIDQLPDTIHSVCKFLTVIAKRSGSAWNIKLLGHVMVEIIRASETITKDLQDGAFNRIDDNKIHVLETLLCTSDISKKLKQRVHLYLLLSQVDEINSATIMQPVIVTFLELFQTTTKTLSLICKQNKCETPGYLAPLILLLDHYQRTALVWQRQKSQCSVHHLWKWFDDRSGRWCNYSVNNNTTIDTAYNNGELTVRFSAGRRKYMVLFNSLVQLNEDTGNRRPIMLDVITKEEEKEEGKKSETKKLSKKTHEAVKLKTEMEDNKLTTSKSREITGFDKEMSARLLDNLIDVLALILDCNTVNAALRSILRVTREFNMANEFAVKGGVKYLMQLRESSAFQGAVPLIMLIIRHILEDADTLKHAVERAMVVGSNSGVPNMFCGVGQNSLGACELHYLLRAFGPIACRDTKLYTETCKKVLKLLLPSRGRNTLEGTIPPNFAQIVKVPQEIKTLGLDGLVKSHTAMEELVDLLLRSLLQRHFETEKNPDLPPVVTPSTMKSKPRPLSLLVRRLTGEHIEEDEMTNANTPSTSDATPANPTEKNSLLFTRERICRLLTELSKSYAAVPQLIANYNYQHSNELPGDLEINGPILAIFIILLLPHTENWTDKTKEPKPSNISMMIRTLLTIIGTYWHNTQVQAVFVDHVKTAYARALQLPESRTKHHQLQSIFNLITLTTEAAAPITLSPQLPLANTSYVKMLIKRGLIADLAKCPHSLDLSSQELVATVNSMLKPLEKLTNLANSQLVQQPKLLNDSKDTKPTNNDPQSNSNEQHAEASTSNQLPAGANAQDTFYNLDGVIDDILGGNGEPDIFAETVVSERSGDVGVEQEIFIEANPNIEDDDDSSSSSDDDDDDDGNIGNNMSDNGSEGDGSDQHEDMFNGLEDQDQHEDSGDEGGESATNHIELEIQTADDDDDHDDVTFRSIMSETQANDSQMEEEFQDRVDNEDDDNELEEDNDDEDTDDEIQDDLFALPAIPLIFEDDNTRPGEPLEMDIIQRRFALHIPQVTTPLMLRPSMLNHPLLVHPSRDQLSAASTTTANSLRSIRGRGNRNIAGERFIVRRNMFHANSANDAMSQIFVSDDFNQGLESDVVYSLSEDMFADPETNSVNASALSSVPSSLSRWSMESYLLDGASVHHLVNSLKPEIVSYLEKMQLKELKEKVEEEKNKKKDVPPTSTSAKTSTLDAAANPFSSTQATPVTTTPRIFANVVGEVQISENFITPLNPLPELTPNAPRRVSAPSIPVLESETPLQPVSHEGPEETPRNAQTLQHLRASTVTLTSDLGLTPQLPNAIETPQPELPSISSMLTTPANIPSLQQLRGSLAFSQGVTPQTSQASTNITSETAVDTSSESTVASDLAAAIMTQLATTSPTPAGITETEARDEPTTMTSTPANPSTMEASAATTRVSTSSSLLQAAAQIQRELESLGIPDGVDPSFLAALPSNIREEVLREQFGIRLNRPITSAIASTAGQSSSQMDEEPQEVSPEFLAALPADMQQEVLEQQRQARYNATQQRPEQPVDPAEFVRNLDPTLRRQVLSDMDDTVLAVLPPELSSEAQGLRREVEQRQLRMHTERSMTRNDLSQLLRHSNLARRTGRLQFSRFFPRNQSNSWRVNDSTVIKGNKKIGRQLLDPESLSCLLILFFLNDNTINSSRLHRILRNLAYHAPTKQWIIHALISILRQTSSFSQDNMITWNSKPTKGKLKPTLKDTEKKEQWLSRTLNLPFGGCVNIFQFQKGGKVSADCFVTVHQQACLDVCKQTLEALSFLARNFPANFAPTPEIENNAIPGPSKPYVPDYLTEFWDILVHLNLSKPSFKSKAPLKSLRDFPKESQNSSFVTSPLGQILSMLSHPVVKQSTLLTDKLLRLLAVISMSLPERSKERKTESVPETNAQPPDEMVLPQSTVTFVEPGDAQPPNDVHIEDHQTAFSETNSVTSSMCVEHPELITLPADMRSNHAGSIVSAFSDGTIAQSDISAVEHPEESMDVEHHQHHSDVSSNENRSSPALSLCQITEKEPSVLIGQLRMAVNVLASGACSDEGLEDATTLLLQLSRIDSLTRECILELLLEGAQETANVLRNEIIMLLRELKEHNQTNVADKPPDKSKSVKQSTHVIVNPASARSQPWRGRGATRFTSQLRRAGGTINQQQRRNAPKPVVYELHLPAMALLTTKRSSQSLFLRVLKVVLQLRSAARKSALKPRSTQDQSSRNRGIRLIERLQHGGSTLREVVAALEADMEAMYDMIDSFSGGGTNTAPAQENPEPTAGPSSTTTETTAENASKKPAEVIVPQFARLSLQLVLDDLWDVLGEALAELAETSDPNAVLVLQPAVEAFFLVHGAEKEEKSEETSTTQDVPQSPVSPGAILSPVGSNINVPSISDLPVDTQKFLKFAETHRTVLNQILRQSNSTLTDGPFSVLVNHTRLLDFDVKRRYFRQELEKQDKGHRREDMAVHIRRDHIFEDSYRELHRRSAEELKNRLYIVFDGEEGQDAGGLLREWFGIMAREMFNPNYALFTHSQGEKSTYLPNQHSHCNPNHLSYFKFSGRVVAKAIYDNKLLDCYFTRSFYKHILGKPVHFTDMEAEDYSFYQGLVYLLEHDIDTLGYELTFTAEVQVFGTSEVHDLKANGRNIVVTEETKREYVKLVCQEKMTGSIRKQIESFLEGFYEIIPKRLISIFDEQELELLIAGLPTIEIEDLKANTEYHKYTEGSLQIQWFWRSLRAFDQADRAKFLQFVTGTSKVPLQGFSTLEGMNGPQKFQIHRDDRSTDRLPCAHTCFNQLDLPAYETYDKLHLQLLKAINECPEGFGLA